MSTFDQGAASHPFSVSFKPDRVVEWRFENIMLPDSGADEAASHGLVSFRIRPVDPLAPGTVLSNAADIYFDLNPPVHTNDAVVVAETSTGMPAVAPADMLIVPNPTEGIADILVKGSIRSVEVLASDGRYIGGGRKMDAKVEVDLRGLRAGVYTVKVHLEDGGVRSGRIIKY
jgi:hypothetical protein